MACDSHDGEMITVPGSGSTCAYLPNAYSAVTLSGPVGGDVEHLHSRNVDVLVWLELLLPEVLAEEVPLLSASGSSASSSSVDLLNWKAGENIGTSTCKRFVQGIACKTCKSTCLAMPTELSPQPGSRSVCPATRTR